MALVNMTGLLRSAREGRYAVGHFNVFNVEMLRGAITAAERKKAPIILAYAEAFEQLIGIEQFGRLMVAAAQAAEVPIAVHLDHAKTLEYVKRAVGAGFTSVMLDASDQAFEENVRRTQEVVAFCRGSNITVEAELGHVAGLEGYEGEYEAEGQDEYTDVHEAVDYVRQTGIDALAVAIGTVHGVYRSTPKLNFTRLKELREALDVPLVMHGGSGLSDDDFRKAVSYGITKTNIFTDLNIAAKGALAHCVSNKTEEYLGYLGWCSKVADAVGAVVEQKIDLFGTAGK